MAKLSKIRIDGSKVKGLAEKLKLAKDKLQVGWFQGAKYSDGLPVALVAAWQEFGTKSAPARPFMRPAASDNKDKWADIYLGAARQWLQGNGPYRDVLTAVGLTAEADIKNAIVNGNHAPLSPVTLALRKLRNDGVKIGGALVGQVAAAVARGETGAGQLGQPFGNQDPLRDTGYMIATVTHEVSQ